VEGILNLINFVRESNRIEGIIREPTRQEIDAHDSLLSQFTMRATLLGNFQRVVAPGMPLRERDGMDVRVGHYYAPPGGPEIVKRLQTLCRKANHCGTQREAWRLHVDFELLHPYLDGNGRTGRALWAWTMKAQGCNVFALPFLHRFYYQTLEAAGK
jgi:Fic family protein